MPHDPIFTDTIQTTRKLLKENPEWRMRFAGYAKAIEENLPNLNARRKEFHRWSPLKVYLTVSAAKAAKSTANFELRYLGQAVAKLKTKSSRELTTSGFYENNVRDFDCTLKLTSADWDGPEAKAFRAHFRKREAVRNKMSRKGNEEHRIESLLLSEFERRDSGKALAGIQPVQIARCRFPMPTPLTASDHPNVSYSGPSGGNIDILARCRVFGQITKLMVIEVKDENMPDEPPRLAAQQALAYATFLRELLRSECGPAWWRLFGFGGKIPEHLEIFAACAMPGGDNPDHSFDGRFFLIEGDNIELHTIYFEEMDDKIMEIKHSLPYLG